MVIVDPESRVPAQGADFSSCEETGEKIQVQDLTQKVGRISPEGGKKISPLVRTAWEVAGVAGLTFSALAAATVAAGLVTLSLTALPTVLVPFSLAGAMFTLLFLPPIGGVASIALTHHLGGITKEKEDKLKEQLTALDKTIKSREDSTEISLNPALTVSDQLNMHQRLILQDEITDEEKQQIKGIIGRELNQWRAIDEKKSTQGIHGIISSFFAEPSTPHDNCVSIGSDERYIFRSAIAKKDENGKITVELEILQLQDASESRIFPERTMIPIRMTLELNPQAPGGYSVGNIQRPRK